MSVAVMSAPSPPAPGARGSTSQPPGFGSGGSSCGTDLQAWLAVLQGVEESAKHLFPRPPHVKVYVGGLPQDGASVETVGDGDAGQIGQRGGRINSVDSLF